jgi:hypothetical protein
MAPAYPHPASAWCSRRCDQPTRGRQRITASTRALRSIENTFDLSVRGPGGWTVDAATIGHDLPNQTICLYALRALLLEPSTSHATRDAAWRLLAERARTTPKPWRLAVVGMAVPGLRRLVRRLAPSDHDVENAAVEGFLAGVANIDLDRDRVFARLYNTAHQYARLAVVASRPVACGELHIVARSAPPPPPARHEDLVLVELHRDGVISFDDAHLIGKTRLEHVDLRDYADDIGVTYRAVRHRRMRAEQKVIAALHADAAGEPYVGRHRKGEYSPRRAQPASPAVAKKLPPKSLEQNAGPAALM